MGFLKQMLELNHGDWIEQANCVTDGAVKKCMSRVAHGFWQENAITGELLSSLESIGTDINWTGKSLRTVWKALKLSVPTETKFGDIAVNVRLWVNEWQHIDGVVFYEAKRQYFKDVLATIFRVDGHDVKRPIAFTFFNVIEVHRISSVDVSLRTNKLSFHFGSF